MCLCVFVRDRGIAATHLSHYVVVSIPSFLFHVVRWFVRLFVRSVGSSTVTFTLNYIFCAAAAAAAAVVVVVVG